MENILISGKPEWHPNYLRLLIDLIIDKYPHYWSLADANGAYTIEKKRPSDRKLAELIAMVFNCNCTELDVYMVRGKHKKRIQILKACSNNPDDMLEMINYYRDKEEYVYPKRINLTRSKRMNTPTLEILKYLIAKGDIIVK